MDISFQFSWVDYLGLKLLGHIVTVFNLLRNRHAIFRSGCIISPSHQQYMRVPASPHLRQYLLLSVFLTLVLKFLETFSHLCSWSQISHGKPTVFGLAFTDLIPSPVPQTNHLPFFVSSFYGGY